MVDGPVLPLSVHAAALRLLSSQFFPAPLQVPHLLVVDPPSLVPLVCRVAVEWTTAPSPPLPLLPLLGHEHYPAPTEQTPARVQMNFESY